MVAGSEPTEGEDEAAVAGSEPTEGEEGAASAGAPAVGGGASSRCGPKWRWRPLEKEGDGSVTHSLCRTQIPEWVTDLGMAGWR